MDYIAQFLEKENFVPEENIEMRIHLKSVLSRFQDVVIENHEPVVQERLLVVFAYKIAKYAFKDITDKAGEPYIHHLLTVAKNSHRQSKRANVFIVGMLHDLLEDTDYFDSGFIFSVFGLEVSNAVLAISKIKGEDYFDYLKRVKENEIASIVKIQDLEHNMDLTRLSNLEQKDYDRIDKYQRALEYLQS